jgi:hypothetical protein
MNKAIAIGLTVMAFVLGACGDEDPPKEETASTTSHLTRGTGDGCGVHYVRPPGT